MDSKKVIKGTVSLKEPLLTPKDDGTLGYVRTVTSDELTLVEKDGVCYVMIDFRERCIFLPINESIDSFK